MKLLITIIDRNLAEKTEKLFEKRHIVLQFISYGVGTANSEMLEYFGIGGSEKQIMMSFVQDEDIPKVLEVLSESKDFTRHGGGVAFTIPISSIGKKTLDMLQTLDLYTNITEVNHGE